MKDSIPKKHSFYIFYHTACQENCNEDYYGKCARRLEERTKIIMVGTKTDICYITQ